MPLRTEQKLRVTNADPDWMKTPLIVSVMQVAITTPCEKKKILRKKKNIFSSEFDQGLNSA